MPHFIAAFVRSSELSKAAAVGVQLRTWAERRRRGGAAVVPARAQHANRRITVEHFTIWLSTIKCNVVYLLTFSGKLLMVAFHCLLLIDTVSYSHREKDHNYTQIDPPGLSLLTQCLSQMEWSYRYCLKSEFTYSDLVSVTLWCVTFNAPRKQWRISHSNLTLNVSAFGCRGTGKLQI